MPAAFIYLGIMLVVIGIWFAWIKRPIYEAILISFVVLLTVTGTWGHLPSYINDGLSTSLIYSMTSFVAMSIILTKTKVIDSCVAIILSLLGRVTGGAGYVSVIASSFMGALSGSGPGNVMATGSITVPTMIKSGFPRELAANVVSNSSYMGNMIPPSSNIVAALGAFTALYPNENMTIGRFWIILWGISLWFVLQRLVMVWILIPKMGIYGYITLIIVSEIFNSSASIYKLVKVTKMRFRAFKWFVLPVISIVLSTWIVNKIRYFLLLSTIPAILIATLVYFALLRLTKAINKEEVEWVKGIFLKNS